MIINEFVWDGVIAYEALADNGIVKCSELSMKSWGDALTGHP